MEYANDLKLGTKVGNYVRITSYKFWTVIMMGTDGAVTSAVKKCRHFYDIRKKVLTSSKSSLNAFYNVSNGRTNKYDSNEGSNLFLQ